MSGYRLVPWNLIVLGLRIESGFNLIETLWHDLKQAVNTQKLYSMAEFKQRSVKKKKKREKS